MPILRHEFPHAGETLDEAIADVEQRYGVTVNPVSAGQDPPVVDMYGDINQLRGAAAGCWDLPPEEVDRMVTN